MFGIPSRPKRQAGLSTARRLEKYRVMNGECWETLLDQAHKYPQITISGQKFMIHRLSYIEFRGTIPDGLRVLHRCDNPRCHNPSHLFLGTTSDNMRDMVAKGRHRGKPELELNIAMLANLSQVLSQQDIAECFSVSQAKVSTALRALGLARSKHTSFGKGHGLGGRRKAK